MNRAVIWEEICVGHPSNRVNQWVVSERVSQSTLPARIGYSGIGLLVLKQGFAGIFQLFEG